MREFITGNQAVVRGAIRAKCDYFAGYPITPASSILSDMIDAFSDRSGIAIQTEDEIAAIGQCIGAAMAGAKTMTASSGPGLSLYSENIGLAQMGEVPLVIINCQRMGPATGGATATGEGDVMFARHVTAGGFPLPVLAASDATSAYRLTYEAFNVAERLRTPVIVLLSKDISLTRQTVELDLVPLSAMESRPIAGGDTAFQPYRISEATDIPAFAPLGGRRLVRFTGSIHGEDGLLTTDRAKIARKLAHLHEKIASQQESLCSFFELDGESGAKTLLISYGAADGAAREAVAQLRAAGHPISQLTLYTLWPVPERALREAVSPSVERVIVPELNIGLYVDEVRKVIPRLPVESIVRYDGGLISPQSIVQQVEGAARKAPIGRTMCQCPS